MMRLVFVLYLFFVFSSCSKSLVYNKYNIVTGIKPIAELISEIGGSHIQVSSIIPINIDPHTFNLKVSDGLKVAKADMVMVLHPHIDGVLLSIQDNTNKIVLSEQKDEDLNHLHHHDPNPHLWLSFKNSQDIAAKITKILSDTLPEKKEIFQKNYQSFLDRMTRVYQEYNNKNYSIIILQRHPAWDYMFEELGIKQLPLLEEFANQQVSFKKTADLINLIKDQHKQVLLIDDAFSSPSSVFKEITKETSAKIVILNPMEGSNKQSSIIDILTGNIELLLD
ncbi:MAG: metal ABC transporter substrate-binding protein [Brevinema sp.]